MAQLSYGYATPSGVAGGKADIAFDTVVSRKNESNDGVLKFGMGVYKGTNAGKDIVLPANSTATNFEGILVNEQNTEQDMAGNVVVKKGKICSVMTKGNIWGRLSRTVASAPTYGATAYLIADGEYKGYFTKDSSTYTEYAECESTDTGALLIKASGASTGEINLADVVHTTNGYTPSAGDYVKPIQVHGSTVNVGAKFGNLADVANGIAVITL